MAGKQERESDRANEGQEKSVPTEHQIKFGQMVGARIKQLHLTYDEVAALSKINSSTIRAMVRPITGREFGRTVLVAVSEALGWPPDYLISAYYPPPPGELSPVTQEMMTALGPYLEMINAIPKLQSDVAAIKARLGKMDSIHPVE